MVIVVVMLMPWQVAVQAEYESQMLRLKGFPKVGAWRASQRSSIITLL